MRAPAGKARKTSPKPARKRDEDAAELVALTGPVAVWWAELMRQEDNGSELIWVYPMHDPSGCVSADPILKDKNTIKRIRTFQGNFCFRPDLEDFILYQGA